MMILRHLLSVLLLPFVVVVVVPRWLMSRLDSPLFHGGAAMATSMHIAGAILFAAGFALFAWCVSLFARVGKGTLAPWDPTQRLVAEGPYRYVRNPMISGVVAMLAGEALFHNSLRVAEWFVTFLIINQTYFILLEEPGLERRFGEDYKRYKAAVPRWIPRRPRE
jgi:protein-S-isoprenylcysteine O-methyltransferase Ste14